MKVIYRYPRKCEREKSHIQNFKRLFKDFEIEKCEKKDPPSPDFLIYKESKRIGIELTSLIDGSLMKVRNAQKHCFNLAMEMAHKNKIDTLTVNANFISNSRIINFKQAAHELYDFVVKCIEKVPKNDYFDIKPKQLKYFNWIRIRHSQDPDWCELKVGFATINPVEEISNLIQKKEKKIKKYLEHCDTCWLLIGIDEFNSPEAFKLTKEFDTKFRTKFERVFVLSNYTDELVEL
ncbi:MAG: hypothetical protein K9N07_01680 [Candidatus Cloacimonetes bacterium]|nr:hypothetical protein [Candidatus Cloacimonadota bacterium]